MKRTKKYSEADIVIMEHIQDNVMFLAFKKQLSDISHSLESNVYSDIDQQYLHSFQIIADELRNKEDAKNNAEDIIFSMLVDSIEDKVNQYDFKELVVSNMLELRVAIFEEWAIAIKAIRSTYKTQKTEML